MIIPHKKTAVHAIMAKFAKPEGELEKVGESPKPDMSALHAHMQSYMGALKNNDHEAATQHMMSFLNEHELHAEKDSDETSEHMEPSES